MALPRFTSGNRPADTTRVQILACEPRRGYHAIAEVRAKVRGATFLSPKPSIAAANVVLRDRAVRIGATAVINVHYRRGRSLTAWSTLTAVGIGVLWDAPR